LPTATCGLSSRTFALWVVVGLAVPFGLGVVPTGSVLGGLTGLLWGNALERSHLAWNVVRISPERQRAKRIAPS
jgi:hypothetical protein